MPKPAKIDNELFWKVKEYLRYHTNRETANHFGIGMGTTSVIKSASTLDEYFKKQRENGRKYYEERRKRIKAEIENPFMGASVPEPIIPSQEPVFESKNGPVIITGTVSTTDMTPMNLDQYSEVCEKQKAEIEELKEQNEVLKAEVERLSEELSKEANSVIDHCPDAFSSTKVEIRVGDAHIIVTGDKNEE